MNQGSDPRLTCAQAGAHQPEPEADYIAYTMLGVHVGAQGTGQERKKDGANAHPPALTFFRAWYLWGFDLALPPFSQHTAFKFMLSPFRAFWFGRTHLLKAWGMKMHR